MRSSVRLAAARRADQHDELAVGDVEADAVDDLRVVPKDFLTLRNETEAMRSILQLLTAPAVRPADHVALERVVDRRRRQRVDEAGRHQQLPRRIVGGEEVAERDRQRDVGRRCDSSRNAYRYSFQASSSA